MYMRVYSSTYLNGLWRNARGVRGYRRNRKVTVRHGNIIRVGLWKGFERRWVRIIIHGVVVSFVCVLLQWNCTY
jgi:hypothetical protein